MDSFTWEVLEIGYDKVTESKLIILASLGLCHANLTLTPNMIVSHLKTDFFFTLLLTSAIFTPERGSASARNYLQLHRFQTLEVGTD